MAVPARPQQSPGPGPGPGRRAGGKPCCHYRLTRVREAQDDNLQKSSHEEHCSGCGQAHGQRYSSGGSIGLTPAASVAAAAAAAAWERVRWPAGLGAAAAACCLQHANYKSTQSKRDSKGCQSNKPSIECKSKVMLWAVAGKHPPGAHPVACSAWAADDLRVGWPQRPKPCGTQLGGAPPRRGSVQM